MDNPFEEILKELADIKEMLSTPRIESAKIEIIDRNELAKRLGIAIQTIIRWVRKGTIPELNIGSNVRYNWPAVIKALEENKESEKPKMTPKDYQQRSRNNLDDNYIKNKIQTKYALGRKDIPQEAIDLKRSNIQLKREIKNLKK